jgi:periplasmic mercuric ion binding protein
MKNLVAAVLSVMLLGFYTTSTAQVMAQKPEWVTVKTPNLRCFTCQQRLDNYIKKENASVFESGLISWKIALLSGEIRFQFYPDRVNIDDIRLMLNNAGFDADSTKATPDSYKKLPPICKRNEDGGGPQKNKPCHIEPYE